MKISGAFEFFGQWHLEAQSQGWFSAGEADESRAVVYPIQKYRSLLYGDWGYDAELKKTPSIKNPKKAQFALNAPTATARVTHGCRAWKQVIVKGL